MASDTPAEKEMYLVATDVLGSSYYVTKLTARRVILTQKADGGSGYEYSTNGSAGWTINSASTGTVSLAVN